MRAIRAWSGRSGSTSSRARTRPARHGAHSRVRRSVRGSPQAQRRISSPGCPGALARLANFSTKPGRVITPFAMARARFFARDKLPPLDMASITTSAQSSIGMLHPFSVWNFIRSLRTSSGIPWIVFISPPNRPQRTAGGPASYPVKAASAPAERTGLPSGTSDALYAATALPCELYAILDAEFTPIRPAPRDTGDSGMVGARWQLDGGNGRFRPRLVRTRGALLSVLGDAPFALLPAGVGLPPAAAQSNTPPVSLHPPSPRGRSLVGGVGARQAPCAPIRQRGAATVALSRRLSCSPPPRLILSLVLAYQLRARVA